MVCTLTLKQGTHGNTRINIYIFPKNKIKNSTSAHMSVDGHTFKPWLTFLEHTPFLQFSRHNKPSLLNAYDMRF